MTAREHLELYARVRGIPEDDIENIVGELITRMNLDEYAERLAGTYSGGNKRKLSVAIALIGNPPVVILDEPSTGMDPVSKRFMWDFIAETMQGRTVIITTHSMEECEALCHKIGIMVAGQLVCLGTPTHLKNKFGTGYQVQVILDHEQGDHKQKNRDQTVAEALMEKVQTQLGKEFGESNIALIEQHDYTCRFEIKSKSDTGEVVLPLWTAFERMEQIKRRTPITNFALSQTTLEQIFLRFAEIDAENKEKAVAEKATVM